MISPSALELLREWYRNAWILGLVLLLMGVAVLFGARAEASTVFPMDLTSWFIVLIVLGLFTAYTYLHTLWISEVVGHHRERTPEEHLIAFLKVYVFYVVMSTVSFYLITVGLLPVALLLWLLLLLYPFAVIVDNVSEVDNLISSLDAWRRVPGVLLEFFLVGSVLLLTSFYLEVSLGVFGTLLSYVITVFFTVPFLTTLLALSYLLRYPLTRRALLS